MYNHYNVQCTVLSNKLIRQTLKIHYKTEISAIVQALTFQLKDIYSPETRHYGTRFVICKTKIQ